jgi:hypothetical protein
MKWIPASAGMTTSTSNDPFHSKPETAYKRELHPGSHTRVFFLGISADK